MRAYSSLSKAYNELMTDVDYDAWAAYINELLDKVNARIYETACGTGAISCRLFDFGHDIVASDISADMLGEAIRTARETGREITFLQQDMRCFEAGKKADAVLSACDGVNYIDEDGFLQFAQRAYSALKTGGVLLFDISTQAKLEKMDGQIYFDDSDDVTCIWKNSYDKARLTMEVTLFIREASLFERFSETHIQYAHDINSLSGILQKIGYSVINVFEFLTKEPCTSDTQRAQFVCRK